jgi:hypothetical protein
MKKVFSIAFAVIILLTGMHMSVATHFCGGEVAAVKWSFSGKIATCGMKSFAVVNHPGHKSISSNCCHNKVTFFKVDDNYNSSNFQFKDLSKNIIKVLFIPIQFSDQTSSETKPLLTFFSPPHNYLVTEVSLPDICIFRI